MRRALDLDVATRTERDMLTLGETDLELLDERRDVLIGDDRALPLLDREDLGLDLDAHVLLDLDLAGQTTAFTGLAARDVGLLRRQHRAAAVVDVHLADTAGATAATRRWDEDLLVGQGIQQGAARLHDDGVLLVVVDHDLDVCRGHEFGLRDHQHCHEGQDDDEEGADAQRDDDARSWATPQADTGEGHESDGHQSGEDEGGSGRGAPGERGCTASSREWPRGR